MMTARSPFDLMMQRLVPALMFTVFGIGALTVDTVTDHAAETSHVMELQLEANTQAIKAATDELAVLRSEVHHQRHDDLPVGPCECRSLQTSPVEASLVWCGSLSAECDDTAIKQCHAQLPGFTCINRM